MKTIYDPPPPGKKLIFRASYVDPKTGQRVYAKQFGKKAFPILVDA